MTITSQYNIKIYLKTVSSCIVTHLKSLLLIFQVCLLFNLFNFFFHRTHVILAYEIIEETYEDYDINIQQEEVIDETEELFDLFINTKEMKTPIEIQSLFSK